MVSANNVALEYLAGSVLIGICLPNPKLKREKKAVTVNSNLQMVVLATKF